MPDYWMCTGTEELQSSPFHSISCVYSGMSLPSFSITIYLLRLCSADTLNYITAKDTSKPFSPSIFKCYFPLYNFSVLFGAHGSFQFIIQVFLQFNGFSQVSLECCWLFLFITRCSSKACTSSIPDFSLQFSTLPQHYRR